MRLKKKRAVKTVIPVTTHHRQMKTRPLTTPKKARRNERGSFLSSVDDKPNALQTTSRICRFPTQQKATANARNAPLL